MSLKPSRTELETAVAGRTKPSEHKRPRTPNPIEVQLDSMTARRQKVIGGDLTGVSKRQKTDEGGGIRNINFVNWIAIVIVLLILAVFFWPQSNSESTKEITGDAKIVESAAYYSDSRVDVESEASIDQSFIRQSDLDRASQFRLQDAQDQAIRALLIQADEQIAKGHYSQPDDDNAIYTYHKVLTIDADNIDAKQGIEYVNGRFLSSGYKALDEQDEGLAAAALKKLKAIDPRSEESIEFNVALTRWRVTRDIKGFLVSAKQAEKDNRLILPARNNALYFYQQILELDESNKDGIRGTLVIADSYIEKANSAILNGRYEAATGYLATVSVIDAKHASIPLIEEMITKGSAIASRSTANSSSETTPASPSPQQPLAIADVPAKPMPKNSISNNLTPNTEASEQEAFDRQYLVRGLDAYYKGNYETAAALLKPLADKGVSRAQLRIGYMYYLGRGFKTDRQEADRVVRAALPAIQKFADEGRVWAQSDIGSLYEDGLVLPRDYGEAIYWYRSAAEQGYPGAQTNLGIMYARGRGVAESRRTAIDWFQRAAKQGDIAAQRNLESMGISSPREG
ncbi:MAG: hypothetical protein ACI9XU_002135 [Arenicella sp.]|jgi:hypothetical protein